VKVQAVVALKAEHSLGVLLDVAGLARSTFFYHQGRLYRPDPQAGLKTAIQDAVKDAKGRYGHRRIHRELMKSGWRVAKKTVLKLMRQLGLLSHVRRRRRYNSFKGEAGQAAPNLLDRDFDAEEPNEKWVTDVTEFRVGESKVYLSPVMDLFDRSIVAYTWGTSPALQLTNTSLQEALSTLRPGKHPLVRPRIPIPARLLAEPARRGRGDAVDVPQGDLPGQRGHRRILRPPQGRDVPPHPVHHH
jgi:putative transposase